MARSSVDDLCGTLRDAERVLPLANHGWIEMGNFGRFVRSVRLWPI